MTRSKTTAATAAVAALAAVLIGAGPAAAEAPAGGQVLCAQAEDSHGNPVGPEVCVPLIIPLPQP